MLKWMHKLNKWLIILCFWLSVLQLRSWFALKTNKVIINWVTSLNSITFKRLRGSKKKWISSKIRSVLILERISKDKLSISASPKFNLLAPSLFTLFTLFTLFSPTSQALRRGHARSFDIRIESPRSYFLTWETTWLRDSFFLFNLIVQAPIV